MARDLSARAYQDIGIDQSTTRILAAIITIASEPKADDRKASTAAKEHAKQHWGCLGVWQEEVP